MSIFKKKEEVVSDLNNSIGSIHSQISMTMQTFKSTVDQLNRINQTISSKLNIADESINALTAAKTTLESQAQSNDRVSKRIQEFFEV